MFSQSLFAGRQVCVVLVPAEWLSCPVRYGWYFANTGYIRQVLNNIKKNIVININLYRLFGDIIHIDPRMAFVINTVTITDH